MPARAKATSTDLLSFKPTQDELDAAKALLENADKSKRKSMVNAMHQFCRGNPCSGSDEIMQKNPESLEEYLTKYLSYQHAKKAGQLNNPPKGEAESIDTRDETPRASALTDRLDAKAREEKRKREANERAKRSTLSDPQGEGTIHMRGHLGCVRAAA